MYTRKRPKNFIEKNVKSTTCQYLKKKMMVVNYYDDVRKWRIRKFFTKRQVRFIFLYETVDFYFLCIQKYYWLLKVKSDIKMAQEAFYNLLAYEF